VTTSEKAIVSADVLFFDLKRNNHDAYLRFQKLLYEEKYGGNMKCILK
jgi:hypothetical protein